jgi:hypothetical protein
MVGHIARMGEVRNTYTILIEKSEENIHRRRSYEDSNILKWILQKEKMKMWIVRRKNKFILVVISIDRV